MFGRLDTQNQKRPSKIATSVIVCILAGTTIAVSTTAIWETLHKIASLGARSQNGSHLMLLIFLGVVTVLTIGLPAEFWERQEAKKNERFLLTTDPLADLENRRELFDSLEMEIKRSNRTRRPFAFLLIQIDDLNRVRSQHGDLVAERALCELAEVLQANCRELDTVVRYGSDEFAIVIPEAGPETVRKVTRRIRERFAGGRELPPLVISIGAATFGEDGKTIDTLLEATDRDLYGIKKNAGAEASLCA
jgi:diguanylate cyclase (GGDEF)-like protein